MHLCTSIARTPSFAILISYQKIYFVSPSLFLFLYPFKQSMQNFASGTLPWCCTRRPRCSKSNNRLCFPCCNWDFGSWLVTAWIHQVFAALSNFTCTKPHQAGNLQTLQHNWRKTLFQRKEKIPVIIEYTCQQYWSFNSHSQKYNLM